MALGFRLVDRTFSFHTRSASDGNHLKLGHRLQCQATAEAPDAALGAGTAAERQVDLPIGAAGIDIDDAGRDRLAEANPSADILGKDADAEPVFAVEREI